jgi:hypothetical protein
MTANQPRATAESCQVADDGRTGQVVLSTERHYFAFNLWFLEPPSRCKAPRCAHVARYQLRYAYVRQRDQRPTYVSEPACITHALRFAAKWGLALPRDQEESP